jgi:hypothetical protein
MVKARPLTKILKKGAFAPMEDGTFKYAIWTIQINSSSCTNPSDSKLEQTIFNILWCIWKNGG